MPVSTWLVLLAVLAIFVAWIVPPLRVEEARNEYVTKDGHTITVTGQFNGKQAVAEIVVFEWKGASMQRVLERAVAEAESRFGELAPHGGAASPMSRAERARAKVRRWLVSS